MAKHSDVLTKKATIAASKKVVKTSHYHVCPICMKTYEHTDEKCARILLSYFECKDCSPTVTKESLIEAIKTAIVYVCEQEEIPIIDGRITRKTKYPRRWMRRHPTCLSPSKSALKKALQAEAK